MKKVILVLCCLIIPKMGYGKTYIIDINGMVCDFCAQGISKTFSKKLPNITDLSVDLDKKQVRFQSDKPIDQNKIEKLIKNAGYDMTNIQVMEDEKEEEKKPVSKQPESEKTKNAQ